jgi:hypothetical protein
MVSLGGAAHPTKARTNIIAIRFMFGTPFPKVLSSFLASMVDKTYKQLADYRGEKHVEE